MAELLVPKVHSCPVRKSNAYGPVTSLRGSQNLANPEFH